MYQVLIADDESIIRKGLRQIIDWNSLGFEIIGEAANGRDALNFMLSNNPDIVLLDIKMPNLHGLETIKQAREGGFTGKVIILSGYSDFTYAQEAIKHGVTSYLTKPVDEVELESTLLKIKEEFDTLQAIDTRKNIIAEKARGTILKELLLGSLSPDDPILNTLGLSSEKYRVLIYEKYSIENFDPVYNFSELLQVSNQHGNDYEFIPVNDNNVVLIKGNRAMEKLEKILAKYSNDLPPEKNSPLDTIFIACGRVANSINEIPASYKDASALLNKRFFCDQYQHIMEPSCKPASVDRTKLSSDDIMDTYTVSLVNHIQAYNRNKIAETLHALQSDLYEAELSVEEEKNLLVDLYLHIKEKIFFLYKASNIPFIANSEAINIILQSYYLYEIIIFLSKQFEMIMTSIGYSSRDSIIDDIVHYIDHNYSENITLENIAPLFGYNSSYLGKIFSKKMDVNFNTYLDNVRIEHSKELLLKNKIQVYKVAELVGYRNVDYFHIKFKKSTGMSPAEFRRQNTESQ